MYTYTSLLAELRTEDGFLVSTHVNRFKAALKKGCSPREVYILALDACKNAIAVAAKNVLSKSEKTGVDDHGKLLSGIDLISAEYERQFMNKVREYLHNL
jgi:hypothetical protein